MQSLDCNAPLQGGHILAHFKVEVIKQPPDNNFDKIFAQIQVTHGQIHTSLPLLNL